MFHRSPSTPTSPESGAVNPSQISMVVVLPAPLGPRRPKHFRPRGPREVQVRQATTRRSACADCESRAAGRRVPGSSSRCNQCRLECRLARLHRMPTGGRSVTVLVVGRQSRVGVAEPAGQGGFLAKDVDVGVLVFAMSCSPRRPRLPRAAADCGRGEGPQGCAGVTVEASSPALIEKVRTAVTDGAGVQNRNLVPGVYTVSFT